MKGYIYIAIVCVTIDSVVGDEIKTTLPRQSENGSSTHSLIPEEADDRQRAHEEKNYQLALEDLIQTPRKVGNVFAFYSLTTLTSISTSTVSSIFTCISTGTPGNCVGRRRKRALLETPFLYPENEENKSALEGSTILETEFHPIEKTNLRTGKRVTVWSTVFTTLTLVSTVGLAGTTVTISAVCNNIGGTAVLNTCTIG